MSEDVSFDFDTVDYSAGDGYDASGGGDMSLGNMLKLGCLAVKAVSQGVKLANSLSQQADAAAPSNNIPEPSAPPIALSEPEVGLEVPECDISDVAVAIPVGDSNQHYARIEHNNTSKPIRVGGWEATICGCCSSCVPNCCMATFCPCVSAAQIAARVGFAYTPALMLFGIAVGLQYLSCSLSAANYKQDEEVAYYGYYYGYYRTYYVTEESTHLTTWSYVAIVVSLVLFVLYWRLRARVRTQFDLPGSCCEDLFVSLCCSCCSLAQMATHLKTYKQGHCDFGPPDTLPAYIQ